jgi:hypothetical protein
MGELFIHRPNRLHVLLRHRPRSIPLRGGGNPVRRIVQDHRGTWRRGRLGIGFVTMGREHSIKVTFNSALDRTFAKTASGPRRRAARGREAAGLRE